MYKFGDFRGGTAERRNPRSGASRCWEYCGVGSVAPQVIRFCDPAHGLTGTLALTSRSATWPRSSSCADFISTKGMKSVTHLLDQYKRFQKRGIWRINTLIHRVVFGDL